MAPVNSTNCRSLNCRSMASNNSSGSSTGVAVIAAAYHSANFSTSLSSGLLSKSVRAISLASETPAFLPTAEPMSIQNGQPIIMAALISTSAFTTPSTDRMASCAISMPPNPASSRG
jgi:hypothetical protein